MASRHPIKTGLTAEYVRSILDYDPATGVFVWRYRTQMRIQWNARYAGREAGYVRRASNGKQYRLIGIDGVQYYAHRLAWLYETGEWPDDEIDHRDGDGLHNWFDNLREATRKMNSANSRKPRTAKSRLKGVTWSSAHGRFKAQITVDQKGIHLGYFDSEEEAHAAYVAAAREHFGEFARTS